MKKNTPLLTLIFLLFIVFVGYGQCDPIPTTVNIEVEENWRVWTVPPGVTTITIEAAGGQGGRFQTSPGNFRAGGKGARYICTIPVTPGEGLALIVGGKGVDHPGTNMGQGAGGGGGTFIAYNTLGLHSFNTEDYILAVGGGGGGASTQTGLDAINESIAEIGSPGIFGSGVFTAGGGGSLTINGLGGTQPDGGGISARSGGNRGHSVDLAPIDPNTVLYVDGGVGGGGAGGGSGGGGGGFSGGNAGPLVSQGGRGAESKINDFATNVTFFSGDNTGNGYLNISYDAPFVDTTLPTITCPATITVNNDPGSCNASNVDFGEINVDDNCGVPTLTNNAPSSGIFPLGDTIITHTVTDFSGNIATCTQTITVIDNEDPAINCPSNITQNNDPGDCGAVVTFAITAIDNCSETLTQTNGLASGEYFPIGTTTNSFLLTDDSGNSTTCTFTVTINNTEDVIAVCQNITVQLNNAGNASINPQDIDGGSLTPCSITNFSVDNQTFTAADIGENTVQLTVSNQQGNTSTCTAIVTVEDILPPTAICQNITIPLDETGNASILATDIDNGSFDNANEITLSADTTTFNCANIGENLVTLTVTDGSGNSSTCEATVTVVGLSAICQDITVQLDQNDTATINANQINNGSLSFGCGNVTLSLNNDTFNCSDIGLNSVVLTVTDDNGNTDSCTATVTVISNGQVDAVCQDIALTLDNTGEVSVTLEQLTEDPGCDSTIDFVPSNFITQDVFNYDFHYENPGQSFTATENTDLYKIRFASPIFAQFQIRDIQNLRMYNGPNGSLTVGNDLEDAAYSQNLSALDIRIYNTDGVNNFYEITLDDPFSVIQGQEYSFIFQVDVLNLNINQYNESYTDGTFIIDYNQPLEFHDMFFELVFIPRTTFYCNDIGLQTIDFIATDSLGNTSTCTASISVEENNPPTASCQNITVELDSTGNASITAADVDDGSSDTCGSVTSTINISSFNCSNIGANDVILTVTDSSGNTDTCTAVITVEDNSIPLVVCQDITIQLDATGNASITANDVDGGSSDACGIASLTVSPSSFTCAEVGPNTVTLTVTDTNGNVSTCTSTVTVEDNVDPIAICAVPFTVQLDATGNTSITVADIENGSTDACGVASTSIDVTDFTCADVGINTVTLTVTDVNGNTSTCITDVTVEDTVAPTANCAAPFTVQLDGTGNASITVNNIDSGSTDACGIASTSIDVTDFTCTDVGVNMVTLTVTDVNGNIATCTTEVTIEDNVAPVAMCAAPFTIQLDAAGMASITVNDIENGSTDACGIASTSIDITDFTCADVGVNTVTLTVIDVNGNTSTCTTEVTVEDNVPPVAVCAAPFTIQLDANGMASITVNDIENGSTDACGLASTSIDVTDFTCADVGTNSVTLTVTDVNGNVSACTTIVTVEDNVPPVAECAAPFTVQLDATGNASITVNDIDTGSTDACGIASTSIDITDFNCADVGPNTVTLTVTDNNGNVSTCTTIVTVEDNVPPVAVCMDITVQLDANGGASIVAADVDGGSTDACGIASLAIDLDTFDCSNVGPNNVSLTVTDVNGNTSSCIAIVTVEDNIAPLMNCPADFTVGTDAEGMCGANVSFADPIPVDNCGVASVLQTAGLPSGSLFPVGISIIEYTATDVNGNTTTCSFTITVIDNDAPTAACMDITIQLDATGNASIIPANVDGGSTDNCAVASLSIDIDTFTCANLGPNNVVLTVTDTAGNTASCTAIVTVEDITPPTVVCQDITATLDATGIVTIDASLLDGGSTDACGTGIFTYSATPDTFTCAELGDHTVTLTVTDENGNSATCDAMVTVIDDTAPTLICQDITVQLDENGTVTIQATDLIASADDACGIDATAIDIDTFTCDDLGVPVMVTISASDASGNSVTCTATVTVEDIMAPQFDTGNLPEDEVRVADENGEYILEDFTTDVIVTDNCSILDAAIVLGQDPVVGTVLTVGIYNITLSAEDDFGNIAEYVFELEVITPLGIGENSFDLASVTMYPNPATAYVVLSNPQNIPLKEVSIYDVTGRLIKKVYASNVTSEISIDVSELASATYMILINTDAGQITKQLVKE